MSRGPKRTDEAAARADRMFERWCEGETLEEIGADYDITRERVRQLIAPRVTPEVRAARQSRADRRAAAVREWASAHPYGTASECAEALGVRVHLVRAVHTFPTVSPTRPPNRRFDREAAIAAVRRVGTGSRVEYDRLRTEDDPASATISNFYGWVEACREAGLDPAPPARPSYARVAPRGREAVSALVDRAVEWLGTSPTKFSWQTFSDWDRATRGPEQTAVDTMRAYSRDDATWVQIRTEAIARFALRGQP